MDEEDLNPIDLPEAGSSDEMDEDSGAAAQAAGGLANVAMLDGTHVHFFPIFCFLWRLDVDCIAWRGLHRLPLRKGITPHAQLPRWHLCDIHSDRVLLPAGK